MALQKKPSRRVENQKIRESAYTAARQLKAQEPHVNFIASWLIKRRHQNGFGEDFEYTLRPREAR